MTVNVAGIHHVSAITAQIERNHHFFTQILGLRLVKKTVNQDNTSSYHLFYADAVGTPGTDMTYFDIPGMGRTLPGVSSINSTAFRVTSEEALHCFSSDEPLEHMGEELALPPFLERRRDEIEASLHPLALEQ